MKCPPRARCRRDQVAAVRAWVEAGAPYASEPLCPAAPEPTGGRCGRSAPFAAPDTGPGAAWVENPDRRLHPGALQASGLSPGAGGRPADLDPPRLVRPDSAFLPLPRSRRLRRATTDPRAYERLVDRLLASPQYGERWGRHWLDVVRFGESQGYETNLPRPDAWPYRDYVIRAFNRDTPFPRFVLEQLAGDTLGHGPHVIRAAVRLADPVGHRLPGRRDARYRRQPDASRGCSSSAPTISTT